MRRMAQERQIPCCGCSVAFAFELGETWAARWRALAPRDNERGSRTGMSGAPSSEAGGRNARRERAEIGLAMRFCALCAIASMCVFPMVGRVVGTGAAGWGC
jgi:hypothetical protein